MFPGLRIKDGGVERDLRRLMTSEMRAIEKAAHIKGVKGLLEALSELETDAVVAITWVARKREQPDLAFEDVDVDLEAWDVDYYNTCGHLLVMDRETRAPVEPCPECVAERGDPVPDPLGGAAATAAPSSATPTSGEDPPTGT